MRDMKLAAEISQLGDDAWIGSRELSALTGFSLTSIQQKRVELPPADPRFRTLKWRMGDVRAWMRLDRVSSMDSSSGKQHPVEKPRRGRPTKAEQLLGKRH